MAAESLFGGGGGEVLRELTEAEWLSCRDDPLSMLHAVSDGTGSGAFAAGFLPRLYDSGDVALFANLALVPIGLAVILATRGRLGGQVRPARTDVVLTPTALDQPG